MGTVNSALCGIQYGLHEYSQQYQQDMACTVLLCFTMGPSTLQQYMACADV